jgi:hypothetical protein
MLAFSRGASPAMWERKVGANWFFGQLRNVGGPIRLTRYPRVE